MKTSDPLVTAVLVCWNHERFVESSVLSAIKQEYTNIEILVFDNASTDSSRRVLENLHRQYHFNLILQKNIGLVATLNKALEMARGKYFAVLSTDDIWLPNKTTIQVDFLEKHEDVHLAFGGIRFIDEMGRESPVGSGPDHYLGVIGMSELMAERKSVSGPTTMARTSTLREIGGYDTDLKIEDASLVYKMASNGLGVCGLPDTLALYRRHSSNWTTVQPIWADICAIGRKYCRNPIEYRKFVRRSMRKEFRALAGKKKGDAIRLLLNEPIAWTWDDVGVGFVKLMIPAFMIEMRKGWRNRKKARLM